MADTLGSRLRSAWNAFSNRNPQEELKMLANTERSYNYLSTVRPDRVRYSITNERSVIASIYTRISVDVAAIKIKHVKTDQNGRYISDVNSELNNRLTLSANIDQTGRAFIQDVVMTMFDEGVVVIVPVDTNFNPEKGSYDILSLRTGRVVEWYPRHVRVKVYNDRKGIKEDILISKENAIIIENPLYAVMNEPNSTLKRLTEKLSLLDATDRKVSSGKMDLIIQLPYVIKSEARMKQAEVRRKDIEMQLQGSQYGIAYTDGTERITQLNRPVENNLQPQIETLTRMLHNQLGLTENVFNGTASESEMLNYHSRTLEPILSAICDGMKRTFLTKTGRTQGQSIMFFREPFKLVPVSSLADIADKFTRNEILSSNELRAEIGYRPVDDPRADELRNKNLNQGKEELERNTEEKEMEGEIQNDKEF